jgi:hypothetical protein
MGLGCRIITRVAAVAVFALLVGSSPNTAPKTNSTGPAIASSYSSSYFFPEARLRKVHLVRPDLLPYPIVYAVYC